MTTIGLISDTHGLLRPEAVAALQGCSQIVHAGDVGNIEILERLREIGPVTAVRGNVDNDAETSKLPLAATLEIEGLRIHVLHDIHQLDRDEATRGRYDIVISGHSHKPSRTEQADVTFINPGSAGPRRFRLPVTVARLTVVARSFELELIELI